MSVTADPAYLFASGFGSTTTAASTASPVGGTGPYTYSWGTNGGDPGITIDSAATAATTFTGVVNSGTDNFLAYFSCTVTDSATNIATSNLVVVQIAGN